MNERYNFLTQISEPFATYKPKKSGGNQKTWFAEFLCDCGIKKNLKVSSVKSGETKSCGCYNKRAASERLKSSNKKYSESIIKHPLYNRWKRMKLLKASCPEWESDYESFYNWSIDKFTKDNDCLRRINEEIPYSPDNCYFTNKKDIIIANQNPLKSKQTCLDRYGVDSPLKSQQIRDKIESTNLEKYGYTTPLQNNNVKNKSKITCLEKYGFEYAVQHQSTKDKIANTCVERYGTKSPSENKDIRDKQIATCISKYGTPYYKNSSLKEQLLFRDWLNSLGFNFTNNTDILDGKEIDCFEPSINIGFEYCGLYWHSEEYLDKKYHINKQKLAAEKNIRVYTVFADEWKFRNEQVKNFISSILGKNKKKIQARKCEVKEINKDVGKIFLEENHIQGAKTSLVFFGIYFENELFGVMSFARHHRQNNKHKLVLDRLAFKKDVSIIGGASRLFKLGIEYGRTNGYSSIISWSDNRWSDGKVYEKMGFVLEKDYGPDYSYIKLSNPKIRISKQKMTKKHIGCPKEKTESEFLSELGFSRIWDCGKKLWVYNL